MAAVTPEDWARVWANAWLDPGFRETLKKDPKQAVEDFNKLPAIPRIVFDKIFDLAMLYGMDSLGFDLDALTEAQLLEIILLGKLNGVPLCIQENEWTIV